MNNYDLDTLVKIYNDWGDREKQKNISPLTSADEMLWHEDLRPDQEEWLRSFIVIWEQSEGA